MWTQRADPFAEAKAGDSGIGSKEYVHIRVQQRNGRKSLTTVQGLSKEFSYNKILKDLKKEFCCNGTVVQDPELGQVIHRCFTLPFDFFIINNSWLPCRTLTNFVWTYNRLYNSKVIRGRMFAASLFRY